MSFHDIINVLIFNRWKIIKVTVITSIILLLILIFIYPITYNATASVLPPEKESQFGGIGGLIAAQDFSSLLGGGLSGASSQLYKEILYSRSAAEYVVRKNDLVKFYDAEDFQSAVRELQDKLNVDVSKEGIVRLNVDVSTSYFPLFVGEKEFVKKLSAELSNSYVEALDRINREKLSSKAKRAREYIEEQIVNTKSRLDSVESALMEFQQKNKAISLPDQLTAAIEAAAELKSEIVKTEIELGLMQQNLTENNKTLIALQNKLQELREQYRKMEVGNQDYLLEFEEVPELGKELAELMREVKIQNEVYIMLQQQYYKEKIQENRDLPTVEVLDEAIPPYKKSSPKRLYATFFGGVFVFLLMSFIVIVSEKKLFRLNQNKK